MQSTSHHTTDTEELGKRLGERVHLRPHWSKTILLTGELGSGKTTFTRGFAESLGISEPIASPTYALVAEYAVPQHENAITKFVHVDLYRSDTGSALSAAEIGELIADPSAIVVIEWPERLPPEYLPQHHIAVDIAPVGEHERSINIEFHDHGVPSETEIDDLHTEFAVPKHVGQHIATVTRVADYFAMQLVKQGVPLNAELVHAGARLHDFVRVCNFKSFDPQCFFETLTPHKLGIWKKLVTTFQGKHHADAGAYILDKRGYPAAADLVRYHHTAAAETELTLEEKCVLLGDRHVLHDTIVSLEERLGDAGQRNHHNRNPRYEAMKARLREMDAEIRALGKITALPQ